MSLYREARSGRRRLWIAVGAAVAVGAIVVGVVLVRGGEPSQAEQLESLQDDVRPALAALELVPIHYESTNATTHAAAADQLAVARTTVEEHTDELRALDAARTAALLADLDELDVLVRTTGRTDEVEQATSDAAEQLRRLAGLD
jgi:pyruvate/2-oxoglutarate dehydrogenase complex dihydrolipoamide acyltransferase (E2) component